MNPKVAIVFDGTCRFCIRQIDWIRARDRKNQFEFVPSATSGLVQRFPALAAQDLSSGLRAIDPAGGVSVGADAVYEIASRLPYWRRLAWLYRVPGLTLIWRRIYAWIAARRYRLAGRCDTSCSIEAVQPPRDSTG